MLKSQVTLGGRDKLPTKRGNDSLQTRRVEPHGLDLVARVTILTPDFSNVFLGDAIICRRPRGGGKYSN